MSENEPDTPSLRTTGSQPVRSAAAPLSAGGFGASDAVELVVDLLAATKLVPADKLALARGRAQQTGSLAAALVEEGVASSEGIARILAARHRMPLVDLGMTGVDRDAAQNIQMHVLERVVAIPYSFENEVLRIAVADPANLHGIDELRLATRYPIELGVGSRDEILIEIKKLVRATEGQRTTVQDDIDDFEAEQKDEDETDLEADDGVSDAPLVRLVNSVLFQGAEDGASDIHFVPQEDALVVRFRIDGVLQEMQRIPKRMAPGVTTRLKVLAKLDIAERRKPQDGRISLNAAAAGRTLDVRVATLPTVEGESVVMRLLDKSKKPPTLEELGLSGADARAHRRHRQPSDRRAARHRPHRFR